MFRGKKSCWLTSFFFFLKVCHCTGSPRKAESNLHKPNQGTLQSEVQRDVRGVSGCGADHWRRHHQPHCLLPGHDHRGGKQFCAEWSFFFVLLSTCSDMEKWFRSQILRSMLYRGSEIMREVAWVIFDEIHYMRDAGLCRQKATWSFMRISSFFLLQRLIEWVFK